MREKKDITQKKQTLTKWTKYLLDFMFYSGMVVTATLPFSLKSIVDYIPLIGQRYGNHYGAAVIIYFVLGVSAVVLIGELRKMGNLSFFIAAMSMVRNLVWMTIAMLVVVLVFVIAGLFSKVLALVFEEAVRYKEENDLTI